MPDMEDSFTALGQYAAEVIDWIETELNDDDNFRDIPEILADARTRFTKQAPTGFRKGPQPVVETSGGLPE